MLMGPVPVLPQRRFNDLYTAVYELIDDAKATYDVLKLHKGSHGSANPHDIVTDFGQWFFSEHRGLIGYVCSRVRPGFGSIEYSLDDLAAFDAGFSPRVSVSEVFQLLASSERTEGQTRRDYLNWLVSRKHSLGAYRGGSSGYDDEARAFICTYFRQLGITCSSEDIVIFNGGAKAVFLATCAALMCTRDFDTVYPNGGVVLAPSGYYQSLRLIPAVFGGTIHVESALTGDTVAEWLAETDHMYGRVLYVPLVNNMDGRVLDRDRAHGIGAAVLRHNHDNEENPVHVIGDDVYAGSYLDNADCEPCPIGAVPGLDPWCVSIVTPSKTVAYPTGRVAFAAASNTRMRAALDHYRTVFSHGRVPQSGELTSAAALCLTPQRWVDAWNECFRASLRSLTREIARLNSELGVAAFALDQPQGGWYAPLRIRRDLFGARVATGIDAQSVLLYYGGDDRESGIAMLPGELFGHPSDRDWHALRVNVAVKADTIDRFVVRLRAVAHALRSDTRDDVVAYALARARRVVPELDATVRNVRY